MKRRLLSVAAFAALGFVPQFVTTANAGKTITTTTTTTYYGSRASNSKNNPCSGDCSQICKTVTITVTTDGSGQTVTTVLEKDGSGKTIKFDTGVTETTLSDLRPLSGTVVETKGNKTVVTTTTESDD